MSWEPLDNNTIRSVHTDFSDLLGNVHFIDAMHASNSGDPLRTVNAVATRPKRLLPPLKLDMQSLFDNHEDAVPDDDEEDPDFVMKSLPSSSCNETPPEQKIQQSKSAQTQAEIDSALKALAQTVSQGRLANKSTTKTGGHSTRESEKRRRDRINGHLFNLASILPSQFVFSMFRTNGRQLSKEQILIAATQYILHLEAKNSESQINV